MTVEKKWFRVCGKTGRIVGLNRNYRWARWLFPVAALVALVWYLVRVIPKPSRADYPCQRVGAPIAFGGVIYLISIFGLVTAFRKTRKFLFQHRYAAAAVCLLIGLVCSVVVRDMNETSALAADTGTFTPSDGPNQPIGIARGIHPGRVAWSYDLTACNWDGTSKYWFSEAFNDQAKITKILNNVICSVAGQSSVSNAWDVLFRDKNGGASAPSYVKGEKITVKLNLNNGGGYGNVIDASPQSVFALLEGLVNQFGAAQQDITLCDPARENKCSVISNYCHTAFPGVNYDSNLGGFTPNAFSYSAPGPTETSMSTAIIKTKYLITMAILKRHCTPAATYQDGKDKTDYGNASVTMIFKSNWGIIGNKRYTQHALLHDWDYPMASYNQLVDMYGSTNINGKTVLNILDGLYSGDRWNSQPHKWAMAPFNGHWPSSFFASQDPVAIESVGLDFLRSEMPLIKNADRHLHEAALANDPPSGTVYKPDGVRLQSLGVHEHWNNAADKKYSRNLGTGNGIELICLPVGGAANKSAAAGDAPLSPAVLPGKNLAQHDFFYAGESGVLRMSLIRGGQVAWTYTHPGRGEISDAVLQPDGNILFAHQFGVTEITMDKQVVWNYDAPPNTEIHTAQPFGANSVWFIQNGKPAKFIVMNKTTGGIERQFELPSHTNSIHGQFRHARMTEAGTLLVAHMDLGKVCEYDLDGKELWSVAVPAPWSATPLTNGNVLVVSSEKFVREINRQGQTVWEWTPADAPDYKFFNLQLAARLPDGNTIINQWSGKMSDTNSPVQAIEVAPDKKIVWALRSWLPPADLGAATTIQVLDDVAAPAALPGNGLAQHPFLYAGEWDTRKTDQSMFLVRDGKVVWQYSIPLHLPDKRIQEFDDATLLSDGNIIFSRMAGAGMVSPDKKLVWNYDAPTGTEIHSIQSIGKDRVLIMRNGNPAQAMIFNTANNTVEKEIPIPTTIQGTHGQFRHIRMTPAGTILVGHMSEGKVCEYDQTGKEVWSVKAEHPWQAIRLKNGNTLITGDGAKYVREVNPAGETVWELNQSDVPDIKLGNLQTANRLANGNTVICNWIAGDNNHAHWPGTVQVFEVNPAKKVVWALSEWKAPDLGPSTSIQLLDEPGTPEALDQQR